MAASYDSEAHVMPYQMVSMKEKTEEWRNKCVDAIVGRFYSGDNNNVYRREQMKISYDLYNSIFNEKDLRYVTDPYKVNDSFPASLQNYNIIKPKIDLLLGEESKRPFNFRVVQADDEVTTKYQEKYKDMLIQTMFQLIDTYGADKAASEEEMNKLMSVGEYMLKDYSDIAESLAYHSLEYLLLKENIKTSFLEGFKDLLISSMEVYYTGAVNSEPIVERVNPLYFSFDYSPEVKYIEDGEWAVRLMYMTPSAIKDRFYDLLDEKTFKQILEEYRIGNYGNAGDSFNHIRWRNFGTYPVTSPTGYNHYNSHTIEVWHVTWKSYKKVGFLSYMDETGEMQIDVVDETYKPMPDETIEWDWVLEVWEGYRIGNSTYVGVQPIPEQSISIDNPNSNKLPYVGLVHNNVNTPPKSLIEIMKPLQYMYIVLWYRLELAIARDKGKVINMDVTQIPKSMGVDVNKWLHYLSAAGVNLINPYEEGWDIPGREGGKPSAFNQFGQVDLTMSNVIAEYINLMDKIEEMIGELSGVSRQRQGQVQTSELVGNVQQTIVQSSHITEYLFYSHSQVKRRVLENVLNIAKNVWSNSGKKKLNYITDDMTKIFMDISDDFLYSDFNIFVTDSTEENNNLQLLKNLYQPAMQNGAQLSEIADIMTSNNITQIKNKLKKLELERQKREQEAQQKQQEALLKAEQMRKETEESKLEVKKLEIMQKEEDSIRDAETSLKVALIQADSKEAIENAKLDASKEKTEKDAELKQADIQEKRYATDTQAEIKRMEARNKTQTNN